MAAGVANGPGLHVGGRVSLLAESAARFAGCGWIALRRRPISRVDRGNAVGKRRTHKAPVGDEAVGRAHAAVSVSNRGLRARGSTYHLFCRNKCCHNILVFHDPTERVIFSQAGQHNNNSN